ncbi:hypothetical protein PsAD2_04090 [Pseudovibrio axinellae]|uniref:Uncharacterized protein n=1 Tax=Pseudovibrio axinellae TaxID=989403 RepID=A0A165U103_9HYPH|nr:hypothetical protein PsAD2_04090 [Pseudovibrio axinellae]
MDIIVHRTAIYGSFTPDFQAAIITNLNLTQDCTINKLKAFNVHAKISQTKETVIIAILPSHL